MVILLKIGTIRQCEEQSDSDPSCNKTILRPPQAGSLQSSNISKCNNRNEKISHSHTPRIKSTLKISKPESPKVCDTKGNILITVISLIKIGFLCIV